MQYVDQSLAGWEKGTEIPYRVDPEDPDRTARFGGRIVIGSSRKEHVGAISIDLDLPELWEAPLAGTLTVFCSPDDAALLRLKSVFNGRSLSVEGSAGMQGSASLRLSVRSLARVTMVVAGIATR